MTMRASWSTLLSSTSSSSRPTNDVTCSGRLPGNASRVRIAGNSRWQGRPRPPGRSAQVARGRAGAARRDRQARGHPAIVRHQLRGAERHEDLLPVRHRHQPGRPIWRGAVVVAVSQLRLAGVHPHTHLQGLVRVPLRHGKRVLCRDRGLQRVPCRREHCMHAVARRLDDVPVVRAIASRKISS